MKTVQCIIFIASLLFVLPSYAEQAGKFPSSFPGISVVSPSQDMLVKPGQTLPLHIVIDSALGVESVMVMANLRTGITPKLMKKQPAGNTLASQFRGTLLIPESLAGPQEVLVIARGEPGKTVGALSVKINVVPDGAPVRLNVYNKSYNLELPADPFEGSRQVYVKGIYADGTERDLRSGTTGTRYKSTNTKVFKPTSNGVLEPVGPGRAFLVVEHRGHKGFVLVEVVLPGQGELPPVDLTDKVRITHSIQDADEHGFLQDAEIIIHNDSELPLAYPLHLVVTDLDSDITVARGDKTKRISPPGLPAFFVRTDNHYFVPPGEYVRKTIRFRNFKRKKLDFKLKLYSGVDI